eukprot:g26746.t1
MTNLKQAHRELFRRSPDERFESLNELTQYCRKQRESSVERWVLPQTLSPAQGDGAFRLQIGNDGAFLMNDWSFTQLCGLARVNKETVNRLSSPTAGSVFRETIPVGNKPRQILTNDKLVRSIHGVTYTRLWNIELLSIIQEFATDFQPPQKANGGGTGLYAGEQDMFAFMIDPAGWTEIAGQAFAPGFFCWNSEVGKRSAQQGNDESVLQHFMLRTRDGKAHESPTRGDVNRLIKEGMVPEWFVSKEWLAKEYGERETGESDDSKKSTSASEQENAREDSAVIAILNTQIDDLKKQVQQANEEKQRLLEYAQKDKEMFGLAVANLTKVLTLPGVASAIDTANRQIAGNTVANKPAENRGDQQPESNTRREKKPDSSRKESAPKKKRWFHLWRS